MAVSLDSIGLTRHFTCMKKTYATSAQGIRILPGQWRPHYPFEQIAWVSPPWPSQEYIWLDFPEAIFTKSGLLYLSHVNPAFPSVFPNLPKVPWKIIPDGLSFQRRLPNGVEFGGQVTASSATTVALSLFIANGSNAPLEDITLQTCAFLRSIKEFSDFTGWNKYVHLPGIGWQSFARALNLAPAKGRYRLGWRKGPVAADLPVMAALSNQAERLLAMTWHKATYALIHNPAHPCMHADPSFTDIAPGKRREISGELIFFNGTLEQFGSWWKKRSATGKHNK